MMMLNEFRDPTRGRRDTPESNPPPRREKIHPDKPPYGSEGHYGPTSEYVESLPLKLAASDIVNQMVDGVYVATSDGRILDANPAFLSLLAVNSVSPIRHQTIESFLSPLPDQRIGHLTGVFKLRALDGTERTVRHYSTQVASVTGEDRMIGYLREVRGVFDRFMLHNQRLANLGTVTAKVVHDINNMLTVVNGFAEVLEMSPDQSEANRAAIDRIVTAGAQASEIAKLVLSHFASGKADGTLCTVDMSELIEETAKLLDILRPKGAKVQYELSGDLHGVRGEPVQLQRVIVNLILNACEALENKPGIVTVRTRNTESAARWPGRSSGASRYVLIEVSDTGKGMDEATRRRIFEPFFTSKDEGQGLGLATIAEILRMHQGSIDVESVPGQGSTFRVYLPAIV
jgi:signal transduction histidine kinase